MTQEPNRDQTSQVMQRSYRSVLSPNLNMVNLQDHNQNTAMHVVCSNGYLEMCRFANLLNGTSDWCCTKTKLVTHLSTWPQNMFKKFLKGLKKQKSTTPLHLAAEKGFDSIVRFLLLKNATIDRRDKNNRTALDIAIREGHREVARALVEDSNWKNLMRSYQSLPLGRHNHGRDTPLRRLINKFPDVAEHVFDNCVTGCGERSEDYNFFYVYDFEFLDDTYMMPSKNGTELLSTINPFNDDGFLKKGAKAYSDDYDVIYKNHPLKIMVNSERLDLLSHPLAISLLKYKWNSLGRFVYYFALAIYIVFIFLYTIYITQTPAPYNLFDKKNNYIDLDQELADYNGTCKNALVSRPPSLNLSKWAVIILAIAQLLKEVRDIVC
uniref:ANK_REP_REGION domain-containing protein n=1 Tax=Heterorhabditis bacteriophora TaxID=37862 RepID=A0A1I7XDQ6_HETBA